MLGGAPMLNLSADPGSFPFASKYLLLPPNTKMMLGSDLSAIPPRIASATNGWFSPLTQQQDGKPISISPLPLNICHAEIWFENGQAWIQDLESAFGTFVNDKKIQKETVLKTGDVITLGIAIQRNVNTPVDITDDHLKPIIAKVSILKSS
ncbi:hypothetical protein BDN72DRAFT_827764 [Pluteus cervinus]|uniref:Uncharacterized protein n=1 Tax=Pluteus cervinus TaxID=181527 RepID=A0ACD3AA19_9AGAR|nr:hypothetical protein BDN72DRAFT_827764 [Pluteus cervinus]